MVWRLMIWQPQYPPVRRLASGLVKGKRARKRLVVQAARRLAIDLWRLSTGQTTPEKLGLIMHCASWEITGYTNKSPSKNRLSADEFLGSNGARLALGLGEQNPQLRWDRSLLSLICSLHKSWC
jgi:hypothetical protein